jgi:hypothetical protein
MRAVLLICLFVLATSGREQLKVEEASFEIKEVDAFGVRVSYAEHTIRFSDELVNTVPVICPQFDCTDQEAIDTSCICNYASKDPNVCGKIPLDCPNSCDSSKW